MRVWVGAGIDADRGLTRCSSKMQQRIGKNLSVVRCQLSVEPGSSPGVSGQLSTLRVSGERRQGAVTTVVRTGNVQPRTASASGTGDRAGARGLRTGVPSEPRTEPCVVIALSRGPHSRGDRTAPSGAIQTVQLQDSPAKGAIGGCGKCTVGLLAHASGWYRASGTVATWMPNNTADVTPSKTYGRGTGGVGDPRPTRWDGRGRRPAPNNMGRAGSEGLALRDGAGGVGDPRATRSPSQSAHLA